MRTRVCVCVCLPHSVDKILTSGLQIRQKCLCVGDIIHDYQKLQPAPTTGVRDAQLINTIIHVTCSRATFESIKRKTTQTWGDLLARRPLKNDKIAK